MLTRIDIFCKRVETLIRLFREIFFYVGMRVYGWLKHSRSHFKEHFCRFISRFLG